MPELRTDAGLAERIFTDYQQVGELAHSRSIAETRLNVLQSYILSGVPVVATEAPQYFTTGDF